MTEKQKIIKKLEKIADKYGLQNLIEVARAVNIEGDVAVRSTCPKGYIWSESLGRCLEDPLD